MYIGTSHITCGGKTSTRPLLRESSRPHGKVLHRTMANVSQCSEAEIAALRLALRHKEDLKHLGTIQDAITLKQGLSCGAVWTVYQVARRLGIAQALGTTREGQLALWQVIARVINQGSRPLWSCPASSRASYAVSCHVLHGRRGTSGLSTLRPPTLPVSRGSPAVVAPFSMPLTSPKKSDLMG